jgi:glycosyltransferase involved in cell wall biosynthesis
MHPRITVVVCALNDADRIVSTLKSVACQSALSRIEVLVIDGGSDDGTAVIARELLEGANARVLSRPDAGIYDAMNRGLREAASDYVYFLNCGDTLYAPDVLERLEGELPEDPWGVTLVAARVKHWKGGIGAPTVTETIPFDRQRMLLGRQDYNHQAFLFSRSAAVSAAGFSSRYGVAGDYHLILRLALIAVPRYVDLILANYEGGGISQEKHDSITFMHDLARIDTLGLRGALAATSRLYAWAQHARRHYLRRFKTVRAVA